MAAVLVTPNSEAPRFVRLLVPLLMFAAMCLYSQARKKFVRGDGVQ